MTNFAWARFLSTFYILSLSLLSVTQTLAQQSSDVEVSSVSGDIETPRRHTRIKNTEKLNSDEAARIYLIIKEALAKGYLSAGVPWINRYQSLEQFNTAPYLSASHGNHYLNNYGNAEAEVYAQYEDAGKFSEGAILFKDSFSIAGNQEIILGPLFIMQKMEEGFHPVSGDWKYIQIQPTGEMLGETNGLNSEKVEYCIGCHLTREASDHLFFLPEEYRITTQ